MFYDKVNCTVNKGQWMLCTLALARSLTQSPCHQIGEIPDRVADNKAEWKIVHIPGIRAVISGTKFRYRTVINSIPQGSFFGTNTV